MTTETFNPNALPYKLEITRADHAVPAAPLLHQLMCDLAKKIPEIRFQSNGIIRYGIDDKKFGDDYYVYAGTEKVGNMWLTHEIRNGDYTKIININSQRITQGRRGRSHTKKTKHYKVALKVALDAYAPFAFAEIAEKIVDAVDTVVTQVASRTATQLQWAMQNRMLDLASYLANVVDNGPTQPPAELLDAMPSGWREKLNNHKVASIVLDACKHMDGIAVKLMQDGTFVAVTMRKELVAQSDNPYDLPVQYQDKFAILKMMEKDQPVAGVGLKSEQNGSMYFFIADGDLLAQTT